MSNFINSLLYCNKETLNNTIEKYQLYSKKIKYNNQTFKIIYNKYNNNDKSKLIFRNMKFIKLNNNNYKMISYNFNNIIDCENLNELDENNIYEYFEGTTINIFYVQSLNKWFASTNRCLNLKDSQFSSNKNHDEQFNETIDKEKLLKYLNPKYNYTFILIHHDNKYYIDYTNKFGKDYKKLLFLYCKDDKMNIITDYNFLLNLILFPNIIIQKKIYDPKFNDNVQAFINIDYNDDNKEITIKRVLNEKYKNLMNIKPNCNTEIERQINAFQHNKLNDYLIHLNKDQIYNKNIFKLIKNIFALITDFIYEIFYEKINNHDILTKTINKINSINKYPEPSKKFIYDYFHYHCTENIILKLIINICSNECYKDFKYIFDFDYYKNIINHIKLNIPIDNNAKTIKKPSAGIPADDIVKTKEENKKNEYGLQLLKLVDKHLITENKKHINKIVGMLIDETVFDETEIIEMIKNDDVLKDYINEALLMLLNIKSLY